MASKQKTESDPDFMYEGRRISFDGALSTVRYNGPLAGMSGIWLGVEWDDLTRGKHNGTHQGEQIFKCLSGSPTAASFIRPTRPIDPRRGFLEALHHKYGGGSNHITNKSPSTNFNNKPALDDHVIKISGKAAEEIGFDVIRKQQAELRNLRVAVLDELQLCGILTSSQDSPSLRRAQEEIAEICPNIIELDLGWNLLETWSDVGDICQPLKLLRILKVNGVRLRSFFLDTGKANQNPFGNVQELHLNENLLEPPQIRKLLQSNISLFYSLETLSLAQNSLTSLFGSASQLEDFQMPTVQSLILDGNLFVDLVPVQEIMSVFPRLEYISLQGNQIRSVGILSDSMTPLAPPAFKKIKALNLSGNAISSYSFVDNLAISFPGLLSLRISKNPLYDDKAIDGYQAISVHSNTSYSLTLARIPWLTTLNYTTITTRDREEGEIYYLSVAEKELIALFDSQYVDELAEKFTKVEAGKSLYPRYEALCQKYDRDSVLSNYLVTPASNLHRSREKTFELGTIASRLIQTRFYVSVSSDSDHAALKAFTRPISRTIDVYRVKALLCREWGLPPLQFRMIYQSNELDPIRDGIDETINDWSNWGEWDVDDDQSKGRNVEPAKLEEGRWDHDILYKDGKRWKKREVEIADGTKAWGDYITDDAVRHVTIRVEPFNIPAGL